MLKKSMQALPTITWTKKLKLFLAPQIPLIADDGFDRLGQYAAFNACFLRNVSIGRSCKVSTVITISIDFKQLGDYPCNSVITTASVDRILHHPITISIQEPSWRPHQSRRINSAQ